MQQNALKYRNSTLLLPFYSMLYKKNRVSLPKQPNTRRPTRSPTDAFQAGLWKRPLAHHAAGPLQETLVLARVCRSTHNLLVREALRLHRELRGCASAGTGSNVAQKYLRRFKILSVEKSPPPPLYVMCSSDSEASLGMQSGTVHFFWHGAQFVE